MSLTNPNKVVTEERLSEFYQSILPYLGGMPEMLANKFSKSNLYSTDAKIVGRWIDGKQIYQKVLMKPVSHGESVTVYADSIDANIKHIVSCDHFAWYQYSDTSTMVAGISPLPLKNGSGGIFADVVQLGSFVKQASDVSKLRWTYTNSHGSGNIEFYMIIKYTKTTDSPVSIGSDTDYSTDEKIIGTWVDGKPIYQKTFQDLNYNTALTLNQNRYTGAVNVLPSNCTLLSAEGYMILGDSSGNIMTFNKGDIKFDHSDGAIKRALFSTNAGLQFISKWNDIIKSYAITLKYTKTTD